MDYAATAHCSRNSWKLEGIPKSDNETEKCPLNSDYSVGVQVAAEKEQLALTGRL